MTLKNPAASNNFSSMMLQSKSCLYSLSPSLHKLEVWMSSGGVGVLHVKGWVSKSFGMSIETPGNQAFGRDFPGFLSGYSGVARKFDKKKLCFFVFFFFNICFSIVRVSRSRDFCDLRLLARTSEIEISDARQRNAALRFKAAMQTR